MCGCWRLPRRLRWSLSRMRVPNVDGQERTFASTITSEPGVCAGHRRQRKMSGCNGNSAGKSGDGSTPVEASENMYGCLPCPQCGSRYRYVRRGVVQCDECGYAEPTVGRVPRKARRRLQAVESRRSGNRWREIGTGAAWIGKHRGKRGHSLCRSEPFGKSAASGDLRGGSANHP
jgi:hypothetical protein